VLIACSSDDTVVEVIDSGRPDSPGTDTGADTGAPDTGTDTGTDTGVDGSFDGGYKADTFRSVLATALCRATARCCFGNANLQGDASVGAGVYYDEAKCLQTYVGTGFEQSGIGLPALDAGSLVVDQVAAETCVKGVENILCTVPGTMFQNLRAACYQALHGTATAGQACVSSASCAPGFFCQPDAGGSDAGTKCEALRGLNGGCRDFEAVGTNIDDPCSWRGKGGDLYCEFDFSGGTPSWTCKAAGGANANCASSAWCSGAVCNPDTLKCNEPGIYFPPTGCGYWTKP
jgi:hypothetical protein